MFGVTEKIGKPGGASRLSNGVLVTAVFRGSMATPQTHGFLSNDSFNRNQVFYLPDTVDFSLLASSEWYNVSRAWSTGGWQIVLRAQDPTGIVKSDVYDAVESVSCDPGDQVINDFRQKYSANWIPGESGLYGMSFAENFDPSLFTNCQNGRFRSEWKMFIPNQNKDVLAVDNPDYNNLQSYTIEEI